MMWHGEGLALNSRVEKYHVFSFRWLFLSVMQMPEMR